MRSFTFLTIGLLFSACTTFGPKPQVVYHRPDIKTQHSKLIIFPVSDFNGKSTEGAKDIEAAVNSQWAQLYGMKNVVPAGPAIKTIVDKMGNDAYLELIKTIDNVSLVEQLHKNKKVRDFLATVTEKVGDYNMAFAIIDGDQKAYDANKPIQINLGYFDSRNLTWKWITKIQATKGTVGEWNTTYNTMLSNSFKKAKELNVVEEKVGH